MKKEFQKNLKRRITEVNNSYFECRNINYSHEELNKLYKYLENKINETDFEINVSAIPYTLEYGLNVQKSNKKLPNPLYKHLFV